MAKGIKQLTDSPIKDLLDEIFSDKDLQLLKLKDNIGGGPSALIYGLSWKMAKQQEQINELLNLKEKVKEVYEITAKSNEQNPSNIDNELAVEHSEDISEIYHITKELTDGL